MELHSINGRQLVFHIHEGDPIPAFRSYAIPLKHHNLAQEIGSLSQTIKESISQIDNILTYLSK